MPDFTPLNISLELLRHNKRPSGMDHIPKTIILWLLASDCVLSFEALKASLSTVLQYLALPDYKPSDHSFLEVVNCCEPFVVIGGGNNLLRLNREFAQNRPSILAIWPNEASQVALAVAKTSLGFLSNHGDGLCGTERDIVRLFRRHPFLEHAATWPTYIRQLTWIEGEELASAMQLSKTLFSHPGNLLFAAQIYFYINAQDTRSDLSWGNFNSWMTSISKFQLASRWGLTFLVTEIVEETPRAVFDADDRSSTALHEAVKGGFKNIVMGLLAGGSLVDAHDVDGKSPLDYAFEEQKPEILNVLLEAHLGDGSKVQIDHIRDEMITYYCQNRSGIKNLDRDFRFRELTMLLAIESHDELQAKVAMFLLEKGTDPSCVSEEGEPAVYIAVRHRKDNVLRILLSRGADPSKIAENQRRESALHLAARSGTFYAVEILLNAGADVNSLDSKHPTPVIAALERNDNLEMQVVIGTIFGRRGNIDIADDEGRRVLHLAAEKGLISLLRFLFLFTDDEHPRDNSGSQPLD